MLIEVAMDLAQPRLMQHIVDVGMAQLDMPVVINTGLFIPELNRSRKIMRFSILRLEKHSNSWGLKVVWKSIMMVTCQQGRDWVQVHHLQ